MFRELPPFYGRHNRPTEKAIAVIFKFEISFTSRLRRALRRVQTEKYIADVFASVHKDCGLSIRRRLQQLVPCFSTTLKEFATGSWLSDV